MRLQSSSLQGRDGPASAGDAPACRERPDGCRRDQHSFAVADENRLGVARPGDVSAGSRHLAFGSTELRHREYTLSVPDEGDALSVSGPGRAVLRTRSFCQSPKRFTPDGLYIDIRRPGFDLARPGEGDKVAVRGQGRRPTPDWGTKPREVPGLEPPRVWRAPARQARPRLPLRRA